MFRLPTPIADFAASLLDWYSRERRILPWRGDTDPYRIWISEVMLQQTQVKAALPYYARFLEAFPTVVDLASADINRVLTLWSGLGYYSRARNLHLAARTICEQHGGAFPDDLDSALSLPGVGRYTAGAVLSIAYGKPCAILDGNIQRVMARYLGVEDEWTSRIQNGLWKLLEECVATSALRGRVSDFNQALMELGALICLPRGPKCSQCPVQQACRSRRKGNPEELPRKRRSRSSQEFHFHVAVIRRDDRFLLRLNQEDTFLRGFWEFPRVPAPIVGDGSPDFQERFGLKLRIERRCPVVKHQITFRRMHFHPCLAQLLTGVGEEFKWTALDSPDQPVPAHVRKIQHSAALEDGRRN